MMSFYQILTQHHCSYTLHYTLNCNDGNDFNYYKYVFYLMDLGLYNQDIFDDQAPN